MEITTQILHLRPYLFGIAYGMLGMIEEAEDIVQDVYEKWMSVESVKDPKAYLGRMTVNKSIDRLQELKKQRESYTGPWLPEPYITLDADQPPTLEYGLLFLLERLNPLERAVFILRESFSENYRSIAELTGATADNCRQLLHRAREKLACRTPQVVEPATQGALTQAFLVALQHQDRAALNQLLRSDIELFSDGGGKRAAGLKPLFGLQKVLKFLLGVMQLPDNQRNEFIHRPAFINGQPGSLIFDQQTGDLDSMTYIGWNATQITRLLYVRNPDKLRVRASMF
ncbi:sigma factor-like helix-turn-helix DNA-binding protein [Spirosoma radiotolerans]|uniref:ECF subfamily RNA polymerase sigma-24 subunit n=1 Tax=Spirosoma radiotolerans TaxID=1379870 RepID=A0A0E3ZST4_9BACT|nr:sigma factor-like helix-turn-helix DNA-binding protein [Spirosoma radiotolerans]AKD53675.1 ECF subfamily RNA polymerase sigma-24 subunit [Spirosoma radiotolerans]